MNYMAATLAAVYLLLEIVTFLSLAYILLAEYYFQFVIFSFFFFSVATERQHRLQEIQSHAEARKLKLDYEFH